MLLKNCVCVWSSPPARCALYCVFSLLIVLLCYTSHFSNFFTHLLFLPLFLAVFILMQLYCLYYTDEGHCIVAKTFGLNLRTFFWLVSESIRKLAWIYPTTQESTNLFKHIMQVLLKLVSQILVCAVKRNKPRPCHPHTVGAEALVLRWHGEG